MMQALTLAETARRIGRSPDWLRDNWRLWHKQNAFPRPIHEHGTLVWDAAHLVAWLDRHLTARQRLAAAAYRAAAEAAAGAIPQADDEIAKWRAKIAAPWPQAQPANDGGAA